MVSFMIADKINIAEQIRCRGQRTKRASYRWWIKIGTSVKPGSVCKYCTLNQTQPQTGMSYLIAKPINKIFQCTIECGNNLLRWCCFFRSCYVSLTLWSCTKNISNVSGKKLLKGMNLKQFIIANLIINVKILQLLSCMNQFFLASSLHKAWRY